MIRNTHCPYCRVELVKAENRDDSRSVEHMVPNAVLTKPRTRRDGDFYACRRCNAEKSKIDDVLSVVARAQSADAGLAAEALIKAVTSEKNSAKKFIEMVSNATHESDGIHATIPISGRDLVDYFFFLAKGQYFKMTGEMFDPESQVIQVEFANKQVLVWLEASYQERAGANPFEDLVRNPQSESLSDGECVIWASGSEFLFIFHRYVGVIAKVCPRSRRNYRHARKLEGAIVRGFRRST